MQLYAVEDYITGSQLMLDYNEQVLPTLDVFLATVYDVLDPDDCAWCNSDDFLWFVRGSMSLLMC